MWMWRFANSMASQTQTKNNGNSTVKSPDGLFETDHIENDLNHVDVAICEFYGIPNPQIQTQDQSA